MLSVNKIAGFLNQIFLQNKSKQPHFLYVDSNFKKLKVYQISFWLDMVKKEVCLWTLKLTASQE